MDDAGTPGLLSIPYIGYVEVEDEIYQNTPRFALSFDNPFYFEGKYAKGIGSPRQGLCLAYGTVYAGTRRMMRNEGINRYADQD